MADTYEHFTNLDGVICPIQVMFDGWMANHGEMEDWLSSRCEGAYVLGYRRVSFNIESDAVLFKLKYG